MKNEGYKKLKVIMKFLTIKRRSFVGLKDSPVTSPKNVAADLIRVSGKAERQMRVI